MNKYLEKIFNEYSLKARVFPAIITVLPVIILKHFVIEKYFNVSLGQVVFGDITIAIVLIYLFSQINRYISKFFFENKKDFPTVRSLLPMSWDLSDEYRNNIAVKVKKDFNLSLPMSTEEDFNINETKRRIWEIIKSMMAKVKDGNLLLQHNIEYGFWRNLIGGSVIASIVSLANIFIFRYVIVNNVVFITSIILLIVYLIPIIFSKKVLSHYSEEYTQILFREYLDTE